MCSLNVHFLFNSDIEMQRITGKVRVITGVLSDKRSKYSVVGTKTPKIQ